jgi:hypothetical protein
MINFTLGYRARVSENFSRLLTGPYTRRMPAQPPPAGPGPGKTPAGAARPLRRDARESQDALLAAAGALLAGRGLGFSLAELAHDGGLGGPWRPRVRCGSCPGSGLPITAAGRGAAVARH